MSEEKVSFKDKFKKMLETLEVKYAKFDSAIREKIQPVTAKWNKIVNWLDNTLLARFKKSTIFLLGVLAVLLMWIF